MNAAVRLDNITYFSDFQSESGIFKWLLHLPRTKNPEIPTFASGTAVRELLRKLGEFLMGTVDLSLVTSEDFDSFGLRTRYIGLHADRGQQGGEGSKKGTLTSLQLEGFLLPECFTNRWLALTFAGLVRYSAPGSFSISSWVRPSGVSQTEVFVTEL